MKAEQVFCAFVSSVALASPFFISRPPEEPKQSYQQTLVELCHSLIDKVMEQERRIEELTASLASLTRAVEIMNFKATSNPTIRLEPYPIIQPYVTYTGVDTTVAPSSLTGTITSGSSSSTTGDTITVVSDDAFHNIINDTFVLQQTTVGDMLRRIQEETDEMMAVPRSMMRAVPDEEEDHA